MKKIIGCEDYHDKMSRVVYDDLTTGVIPPKDVPKNTPAFFDVVEVIDSRGLIGGGNLQLIAKEIK